MLLFRKLFRRKSQSNKETSIDCVFDKTIKLVWYVYQESTIKDNVVLDVFTQLSDCKENKETKQYWLKERSRLENV
jgi:hypothetical protein